MVTIPTSPRTWRFVPVASGCFSSSQPGLSAMTTASVSGSERGIMVRLDCSRMMAIMASLCARSTTFPSAISSMRRAISRGVATPRPNSFSSSGNTSAWPSRKVGRNSFVRVSP